MACQAGETKADVTPCMRVNTSRSKAVTRCRATSHASTPITNIWIVSTTNRRRRRSRMSARAPAGSPKRNIGNIVATCTMATVRGSASSVVINHPAAALCIHPPMLETTVTVHTTAKAACLNGLSEGVCCLSAALLRSLDSKPTEQGNAGNRCGECWSRLRRQWTLSSV